MQIFSTENSMCGPHKRWKFERIVDHLFFLFQKQFGRFLDNNYINGTLDITSMSRMNPIAQKSKGGNSLGLLQMLRLKNNKITSLVSSVEPSFLCWWERITFIVQMWGRHILKVIIMLTINTGTFFLMIVLLISIVLLCQSKQNLQYLIESKSTSMWLRYSLVVIFVWMCKFHTIFLRFWGTSQDEVIFQTSFKLYMQS